jgi:hypothetical protein
MPMEKSARAARWRCFQGANSRLGWAITYPREGLYIEPSKGTHKDYVSLE